VEINPVLLHFDWFLKTFRKRLVIRTDLVLITEMTSMSGGTSLKLLETIFPAARRKIVKINPVFFFFAF
jgi:hypothetical protein